jgi:hypothetical protein
MMRSGRLIDRLADRLSVADHRRSGARKSFHKMPVDTALLEQKT